MAPVFHTDDNAPGFIMSSVQSPCLLFCPAHSPPLLHTPWLPSFVSLSVTALPVHCENEKRSKPYPPARHAGKCSLGIAGSPFSCYFPPFLSFLLLLSDFADLQWNDWWSDSFYNSGWKWKHISVFCYKECFMNIWSFFFGLFILFFFAFLFVGVK